MLRVITLVLSSLLSTDFATGVVLMIRSQFSVSSLCLTTAFVMTCSLVEAGLVSAPVEIFVTGFDDSGLEQPLPPPLANGDFQLDVDSAGDFAVEDLTAGSPTSPVWFLQDLDVSGNTDPNVTLAFTLTNTSAGPAEVTMSVTVPLGGTFGPSNIAGGVIAGGVTDLGDPVSIENGSGLPIFQGFVDGSPVLTLLDSTSLSGTSFLTFSDIGTSVLGPASSTFGITINAIIGAGDTLAVTSEFEIIPIPEPAGILLLAMAAPLAGFRRR